MDAKEARKITDENLQIRADYVYDIIQSQIEKNVAEGMSYLMYYSDIPELTEVKLKEEGYAVTVIGSNGYYGGIKINW